MLKSVSEMAQLWDRALIKINERIAEPQLFESFFNGSYIDDIHGSTIVVVVNSKVAANLMKNKYNDIVIDVIKELTNENCDFEYITANEVKNHVEAVPTYTSVSTNTQESTYFKDAKLDPNYVFDNFVVGDFNREAQQASLMVAATPGKMFNPLFIYSHSGLGKTHLLHSIGNYVKNVSKPGARVLYIAAYEFVDEYMRFVKGEKESESLKDYFKDVDVLLFDDVQFLSNKVKTEEMFFYIYNAMINSGKQIVIMSDRQPNELNQLEDRLVTRFSQGLVVKIEEPDQSTCVEILKKKIVNSGRKIDDFDTSVLFFLAEKFSSSIRELEGSINRLTFYAETFKQSSRVTMDIAIEAMKGIIGGKNIANQMSEQKIINTVADYYNITPTQLTGKVRTGQIALARHIAMYLIRFTIDVPLKKIGDMFGGRDHTTVMSGIEKVESMLKTDETLKEAVEELKRRLNS